MKLISVPIDSSNLAIYKVETDDGRNFVWIGTSNEDYRLMANTARVWDTGTLYSLDEAAALGEALRAIQ